MPGGHEAGFSGATGSQISSAGRDRALRKRKSVGTEGAAVGLFCRFAMIIPTKSRIPQKREATVCVESRMRIMLMAVSGLLVFVASTGTACSGPSVTVANEWIRVMETGPVEERFVTYAGPATISRSGDIVRMSSVIDSTIADDAASQRHRVSWKDEWEYDCETRNTRPVQYTEYSGRMGTGEKMFSYKLSAAVFKWITVKPGSVGEALWKIACGKE